MPSFPFGTLSLLLYIGLSECDVVNSMWTRRHKSSEFESSDLYPLSVGSMRYKLMPRTERRLSGGFMDENVPPKDDSDDGTMHEKKRKKKKKNPTTKLNKKMATIESMVETKKDLTERADEGSKKENSFTANPEVKAALMEYLKMSYGSADGDQIKDMPEIRNLRFSESRGILDERLSREDRSEESKDIRDMMKLSEKLETAAQKRKNSREKYSNLPKPAYLVRLPLDVLQDDW